MNTERKYKWHRIADELSAIDFSGDGMAGIEVENKKLCLVLFREELYACNTRCPHAGGILTGGYIDASGNIVCPVHRYKFNLKNGRNSSGEGYHLKTYPVEKRADGIFVGIERGENNIK